MPDTETDLKKATSPVEHDTAQEQADPVDPTEDFEADLAAEEDDLAETIGDEIGDDAGEDYEATEEVENEDDVSFEDDADLDDDGLGYGDEEDEEAGALN